MSNNADPAKWDESRYDAFVDELCGPRQYQKDAVFTSLRFLLGGQYASLRALARENFEANDELKELHGTFANMERHLQLPNALACSIDLATGTGKSYVLYGLGSILLASGAVDRVLVLCPSTTIETGLREKFRELAGRAELRDALPSGAKVRVPTILDASASITEGAICVENYHAVFAHVRSSVRDSFLGKGGRTAVLCDEFHHVVNEVGTKTKEWKNFLTSEEFGFQFVLGVSGTCYVGDEYFSDVIYRYSLRQAIEDRYVKHVEYVAELPETNGAEEKWQLIHNRHLDWKKRLRQRKIRPLTVVITKAIADCKHTAEELTEFLQKTEKLSAEEAAAKVLVVTSAKEHEKNLAALRMVDSPASKVEWLLSVSMLTEGWDVKNVFQIVPHEERAFNSKLLIAQVLGRGLRVPDDWTGEQAVVTVFNHDRWSASIRHLVNEVLEIERRITAEVTPSSSFHFDLHTLDYTRDEKTTESIKKGEYNLLKNGYVELPTQIEREDVTVTFESAIKGKRSAFRTSIDHKTYSVDEVGELMFNRLKSVDGESKELPKKADHTAYAKKFPLERCREIVRESLKRAKITSGRVTDENRQRFLKALGTLNRRASKSVVFSVRPNELVTRSSKERHADSCSAAELRRGDRLVWFGPESHKGILDTQREFFTEVTDRDGPFGGWSGRVESAANFRTPLNIVITEGLPERKFVRELCEPGNARAVRAWLKNTAQRFYWVEYAWRKGDHQKRGEFSPDFFIRTEEVMYVVEIKDDGEISEPSAENRKKHEYASDHFYRLNTWLEKEKVGLTYQFNFLSPKSYGAFFQKLREDGLKGFRSELDLAMGNAPE